MQKIYDILKIIALGTFTVAGGFLAFWLFQLGLLTAAAHRDEARLAMSAQAALDTINRKQSPGVQGGTLDEINEMLRRTTDLETAGQKAIHDADGISTTEAKMLPVWNDQFTSTFRNIDATVATVNSSASELTQAAVPVLNQANRTLESADEAVAHLDALANGPDVKESMDYIAASSKSIADGTAQADAILADAREEADKFTHPPKKKLTFWGGVMATVEVVHKFEPPLF